MNKKYLTKIIATDNEGLQMISACCAGAKVKISDIKFLRSNKIFLLSIERTKIESGLEDKKINSVCKFDFVDQVKSKNINQKNDDLILELIGIDYLKNNAENLLDLSITPPYLTRVCEDIIFIKESFLMDLQDKEIDMNIHDLIKQGVVKKNKMLLGECALLFSRKIILYFDKDITKLPIQDMVNYILLSDYLINYKVIKKPKSYLDISYKLIDSIKDEEHDLATHIKLLLKDFINKDKNSFYKNTKKMLAQNKQLKIPHDNNFIGDWLIFQRYMRYKEFRQLFGIR